ncbi:MAG: 4Fe-4S binding protein [Candidatus Bathyarchaeota archaeon]|nr:4Fe-4S binding protein [Candidatus Bathyarchaeota archaeon]
MLVSMEVIGEILRWIIASTLFIAGLLIIHIWIRDKTRRISLLRVFVQFASLVAIYFILTIFPWILVILIVILVSTIFLGRFFCGWICPFGLYMDLVTIFRKSIKVRYLSLPNRFNKALNKLRYAIFAAILAIPFFLAPLHSQSWQLALFFAGSFKHLTILLGPLEPLIIPDTGVLVIEGLNFSYPYVRDVMFYSGEFFAVINGLLFLILTLLGTFLVRRLWCRFCPLGLSFVIINRVRGFRWIPLLHLDKSEEKCTKCGICKRVCPTQVTEVYENRGGNVSTSICIHCFRCVEMCPYKGCLTAKTGGKTVLSSRNWLEPSKTN